LGRPLLAAFGIGQHAHLCEPHVAGWHGPPVLPELPEPEVEDAPLPAPCELFVCDVPDPDDAGAVDPLVPPAPELPLDAPWPPFEPDEVGAPPVPSPDDDASLLPEPPHAASAVAAASAAVAAPSPVPA
jgi:hypothetical protein